MTPFVRRALFVAFWLAFALLIATFARADPYAATVHWSDGTVEEMCALDRGLCEDPRWRLYLLHPNGRRDARIIVVDPCRPEACFAPGWGCIKGYNCR